jgi:phosphoglycolate phosphatase
LSDAVVRGFVGDGARALLARALEVVLPPDGDAREAALDAAFAAYATHHDRQCTVHARCFPNTRDHLRQLHERGHPLAVVTNKPARFAVPIVRHLGIAELLPVVVGGDTLPQKKPDPAPLRHALQQLGFAGTAATGAVMVGDSVQDLRAGKAAGLGTIACLFGYGDPAALRREGADSYWGGFGTLA